MGKRYSVTVSYSQTKEIGVWAKDEQEAEEKAVDIVLGWNNVDDAEAVDVSEE
jgi:hypothetical protein